ncbi:hypothetical protein [Myroides sp. N17-2]|uniref:hypothetical protein n=1 Tax=Myroides sp. N17-2 TaxID=2030799 RepID=UPI000EFB97EE|nr:hypothetical protein [Myroides sp. N17-2]
MIDFQIDRIELGRFSLTNEALAYSDNIFEFKLDIEHRFALDEELILVVLQGHILSSDKVELAVVEANMFYKVPNLKNFENKKEQIMELPAEFITMLHSMSVSTLRGIMFSQFRGTNLHHAILPVLNHTSVKGENK